MTAAKGLNSVWANTEVTSWISRPKRVSGLSEPKRPMASSQGIRWKGVTRSMPSISFHSPLEQALVHRHDIVLGDEGHLLVHLGELGLTVGAQVLVAVAAGDLEIAVKAGQHQDLLVELGALGQRIKVPRLHTAGTR